MKRQHIFLPELPSLLFLISGIAFIPYTFNSVYGIISSSIRLCDLGLFSALASCLILCYYANFKKQTQTSESSKKKSTYILYIVIFLFLIIICIQFFYFHKLNLNEFFLSAIWITIPFFCYLYSKELVKFLPVYIYLIWIANLIVCYFLPGEKVGITGNRNWNAALTIVCLIFSIYQICKWIKYLMSTGLKHCTPTSKKYFKNILYLVIIILNLCLISYSIFILYKCESRGALLSGIIVILLFFYLKIIKYLTKKLKLFSYLSCIIFIMVFIITILFSNFTKQKTQQFNSSTTQHLSTKALAKGELIKTLGDDVRIPLWIGTLDLIKDYPVLGTNPSAFESIYASYRPLDYFTKPTNTVRSNHPHNTLLYIGAVFGIPGLILWCILWLYPIVYCFLHYSKLSTVTQLAFYAYIFLFLHGLLDLVLFHWPTVFLAAIFLGLLWKETFGNSEHRTLNVYPAKLKEYRSPEPTTNNQQPTTQNLSTVALAKEDSPPKTSHSKLPTHHTSPKTQNLSAVALAKEDSSPKTQNLSAVALAKEDSSPKTQNLSAVALAKEDSSPKTHHPKLSTQNSSPKTQNPELTTRHSPFIRRSFSEGGLITKSLLIITALIILLYTIYGAFINYKSKYYFETGNYFNIKKKTFRALYQYQKGLDYKLTPKYLYKAGVTSITTLDNPELALYFFNFFNYMAQFDYAHKNGFIALSLLKTGNKPATIPFLIKEVVNYPLSAGAWYRLYLMQSQLKMYDAAKFSLKNTYRALDAKNLPKHALQLLLENPEYDNHPDRIPKEKLEAINLSHKKE